MQSTALFLVRNYPQLNEDGWRVAWYLVLGNEGANSKACFEIKVIKRILWSYTVYYYLISTQSWPH